MTLLLHLAAEKLPLEWFVLAGSFIEEIISPIPTYAVMATAGSAAHVQGDHVGWIFVLAIIGALGKTVGSFLYYILADLFEDVIMPKYGKYLGVTHQDIEAIGARFHKGAPDVWALVGLRVIPVIPSVPISILAGLIKVPARVFIWTTMLGNTIKNVAYLFMGYFGLEVFRRVWHESAFLGHIFEVGLLLAAGIFVGWMLWGKE